MRRPIKESLAWRCFTKMQGVLRAILANCFQIKSFTAPVFLFLGLV